MAWSSTITKTSSSTKSHGSYSATLQCELGFQYQSYDDRVEYAIYTRARYSSANATGYGVVTEAWKEYTDKNGATNASCGTGSGVLNYGNWVADTGWKYFTVYRTHSNVTVKLWGRAYGSTVSGYGAAPESTGWFSYNDTVSPLPSYTVTLNPNGGTAGTKTLTKWYNESLSLSSGVTAPTRSGYTFVGWYANSSGTGSKVTSYTTNAATTFYAKWTPVTYTLTYKPNGASGSNLTQSKTHGTSVTLKLANNSFSRTGYTLSKWNTASNGTGTSYNLGATYNDNADKTFYAIWNINTWSVSYNGNKPSGASGSVTGVPSSQTKTYNTALTLTTQKPALAGYNFVKWNTAANGSGTDYNSGVQYEANNAATLYAVWQVAHSNPTIESFRVQRCLQNGTLDDQGTYVLCTCKWKVDHSTTGFTDTTGATLTITISGTTDTVTLSGTEATTTYTHSKITSISSAYPVTAVLADSKGYSSSAQTTLSVAFFTMHFRKADYDTQGNIVTPGGQGMGIGAPATDSGYLNVGMWLRLYSKAWSTFNNYTAINVKTINRSYDAIRFIGNDSDGDGDAMVLGNGGMFVVGSGESAFNWYKRVVGTADSLYSGLSPGTETTFVTSDNTIVFVTNANTVANRIPWIFTWADSAPLLNTSAGAGSSVVVGKSSNNGVSANTNIGEWYMRDKNDYWTGCLVNRTDSSGGIATILGARNQKTDGTNMENYLTLTQNKDGSRSYSVTDAGAFRTAIGVGTIGTKSSLAASDIPNLDASKLTAGTLPVARLTNVAWTYLAGNASAAFYVRWCKVANIVHVEVYGSKSLSSNTNTKLATTAVTSGNRPSKEVDSYIYSGVNHIGVMWIGTDGIVWGKNLGSAVTAVYGFLSYPVI